MIIDMHMHLFPDKLCPKTIENLAKTNPKQHLNYYSDGSLAGAEKSMEKWGVNLGVMLAIATNPRQQKSVNDFAKDVQQRSDRIIAFGSIHPEDEGFEKELNRIVDMGLYGIKLHPDYQGFFINEKRMYKIYRAIGDRNLPVVFHTGYDPISPGCIHAEPQEVAKVAKAFPDLQIIAAHTGGIFSDKSKVAVYLDTPNVYFDTAIASYTFKPEAYRKIIDLYGAERFVFATDNPWGNVEMDQAFMEAVGLNLDEREQIYHKNAKRILGIF